MSLLRRFAGNPAWRNNVFGHPQRLSQQQQHQQRCLNLWAFQRRPQRGLMRISVREKPEFSTNPYVESMRRLKVQAKFAGKVAGYALISLTATVTLLWQSYHLYIEYMLESTPSELGYKSRNLLHGAYFREKIAPDFAIAAVYLREVLEIALEEKKLDEASPTLIRLRLRLADDEAKAGNLLEAITEYTRSWKLLLQQSSHEERQQALIQTAKHLGDLYLRIGHGEQAEEFFAYALHASSSIQQPNDDQRFLKVTTTTSLASLYATQRNFKLALPLFTQALKELPDENTVSEPKWTCLRAIIMNQLSETMYGLGKHEEAMGWAQDSLRYCNMEKTTRDCQECGGVAANNLGRLLELKKEFDQSWNYYQQAMAYADSAGDADGSIRYADNALRVESMMSQHELPVTTTMTEGLSLPLSKKGSLEEDNTNNSSSKSSWKKWLSKK
ncbi:uncharacterized protein BYT42DRAFT_569979 [Radiomyces spectabilis]|uniref:uncharacterized protein n=1 Tax=Radiomyces spectabilis TaxID=64574 RepID=UPI0022210485|nr:uncharacterized protein BYT42DRAFT_569979 [Radiomyces spectabilis]KAI8379770.1 hypothetical protein BYT42DRAFT_569979 [Radiomyces spectabilis]